MEKMLMNPNTGSVAPESEWVNDFNTMSPEEWGGDRFEDAGLIEVVPNVEGQEGYIPECGAWRETE